MESRDSMHFTKKSKKSAPRREGGLIRLEVTYRWFLKMTKRGKSEKKRKNDKVYSRLRVSVAANQLGPASFIRSLAFIALALEAAA